MFGLELFTCAVWNCTNLVWKVSTSSTTTLAYESYAWLIVVYRWRNNVNLPLFTVDRLHIFQCCRTSGLCTYACSAISMQFEVVILWVNFTHTGEITYTYMQFNLQFNLRNFPDQCGQLRVLSCVMTPSTHLIHIQTASSALWRIGFPLWLWLVIIPPVV